MKSFTLLIALVLSTGSVFAQENPDEKREVYENITIIRHNDQSISIEGITSTEYEDTEGNPMTKAAFFKFLDENQNFTMQCSLDTKTGLEKLRLRQMWVEESKLIGQVLPSLSYSDIDGAEIKLIDGKKPFMFCFWGTGCGNCIVQLRILNWIAGEFPDLQIVAITPEEQTVIKKFLEDRKFSWENVRIISDYKNEWLPIIQSEIHPTTILVSKSGVIDKIHYGTKLRQMVVDMDTFAKENK